MSALLLILLSAALVNLTALTTLPQWRPFALTDDIHQCAKGIAIGVLAILPPSILSAWLLAHEILAPSGLAYLHLPAFVLIIAAIVTVVETLLPRIAHLTPVRPAFPLLMTTNCAIVGAALFGEVIARSALAAILLGAGVAVVFGYLLMALAALRERMNVERIPAVFRGTPALLIAAGLVALGFMGFTGLIQE